MKRANLSKLFFLLLFTVYCLLFTKFAFAFREMEDYVFQYEKYRNVYSEFTVSRDKFLKYEILSAREQVTESAKNLILQRNQVLRTYFLALKYKLRNTPGIVDLEKEGNLIGELDKKILWLEEQSDEVKEFSDPSIDDLFIFSDRIEDKEKDFMQLAYQSLAEVILGKIRDLHQDSVSITTLLKDDVTSKTTATQSAQLNLWTREVEVKNYLAQKEIEAAEINLWNLKGTREISQMKKHFGNLKTDAQDAKIHLQNASSFQQEVYSALNND